MRAVCSLRGDGLLLRKEWGPRQRAAGRPHGLYIADGDLWCALFVFYPDLAGDSGQTHSFWLNRETLFAGVGLVRRLFGSGYL